MPLGDGGIWPPRRESNPDLELRRLASYSLDYGEIIRQDKKSTIVVFFMVEERPS